MGIFTLTVKRFILMIVAVIFVLAALLISFRVTIAMQEAHNDGIYQRCTAELLDKGTCFDIAYRR